jgi:hypothetical protein
MQCPQAVQHPFQDRLTQAPSPEVFYISSKPSLQDKPSFREADSLTDSRQGFLRINTKDDTQQLFKKE